MSYILDALKKAEAQRTLGALPNIHAPAVFAAGSVPRAPLRRRAWRWAGLAALVMVLVALAWLRPWQPAAVLQKTPPSTAPAAAVPAPVITPALPPPLRAAALPRKAVLPETAKPKGADASARLSMSHSPSLPQQRPAPAPPAKKATPAPAPSADAGEAELQTLHELPAQIQNQIPPLVIGGYIYSSNRAERSLLINNQLLREGDSVAPGLILEKMLRGTVVLNYQGYRYRMSY